MLTTVLSAALLLGLPLGMAAFLCRFFSGGTIAGAAVLFSWLSTMRVHID
jgi:hypothetical protein